MSLRRAIARAGEAALPLRRTSKKDMTRIGTYPVPPESRIWWDNRYQVPGGEIKQTFSPYQQKIMWQWFWNAPARWYWRFSKWAWPIGVPSLIFYIFVYKSCEASVRKKENKFKKTGVRLASMKIKMTRSLEADVEADIRAKSWW